MTPPKDPMPAPAKGGLLKNLSPKQKKVAIVAGVGALLALIFLLSRRKSESAPAANEAAERERAEAPGFGGSPGVGGPEGGGGGGGFGNETGLLIAQGEAESARLEEMQGQISNLEAGTADLSGALGEARDQYMKGQADEEAREARMGAALSKNSRQLAAVKRRLENKKGKGGKGKGGGAKGNKGGKGKGGGGKGKGGTKNKRQQQKGKKKR